ncbi:MAG TPA: M20/M25/M40 family metallo-hydrolase [Anaerolineaceae bacterium]|nr:M20/M25/M40 family metallo-hydrolase [Anaerolineaceae bacterium]
MNTPSETVERVLDLAAAIQQVPSPTHAETQRASFVMERFQDEGLVDIQRDEVGNVLARLPGKRSASPVVIAAHLDSVFPLETDLKLSQAPNRLAGPGIGDNALGLAGLFGLVWELRRRESQLPGDVWLVGTAGEEGLGDLVGMRQIVKRFGAGPTAYLILEGMGLGQVFHRGLGVRRYEITSQTRGGHSWIDYGSPSAVHHLAALVTRLASIPLPVQPRTTLNVGVIQGGTSVNTIAAQARLELDLRSVRVDALDWLIEQVEKTVFAANLSGVEVKARVIGDRPAGEIAAEHPLVQLAQRCLLELDIEPHLIIGSTDANIPLSCGYPAICIGLTSGGRAHTTDEFIYTQPLAKGLEQLVQIVSRVWQR